MGRKIIYYYQTFTGLKDILFPNTPVTHIHLSAVHFGLTTNNKPYIHLNDNTPNSSIFNNLWIEIKKAQTLGIKVVLMVGGAGGAFQTLFSNFETYYNLLKETLIKYNLDGIDLDIEEEVSLENVKLLINKISIDFKNNDSNNEISNTK